MEVPREKVVVCDNGTGYVKCGFAGDNFPRAVFPCLVGRPTMRYEEAASETTLKDVMVGNEAADQRNNLEVRRETCPGETSPCVLVFSFPLGSFSLF